MRRRAETSPFSGATVVVTGASSGLGASLAEALTAAGANPVLFARSKEGLTAVAERCRQRGGEPLVVIGDVTVQENCEELISRAIERFGRVDILVACAGVGLWAPFDELRDPAIVRRVMEVNYCGVVNPFFYALPHIKKSRGMLVAISSVQGKFGVPYHTGYAASKHAVQGFCDSLRMELQGTGVDVLTVMAHWIRGTRLRERALGKDGAPRGKGAPAHGSGAVPVEEMTEAIMEAIRKRKRVVFVPAWLRFLSLLSELAPSVADRLIARRVEREASRQADENDHHS
ncbi:MAG: SDR family oxidoreductase [Opitutales bacterium]